MRDGARTRNFIRWIQVIHTNSRGLEPLHERSLLFVWVPIFVHQPSWIRIQATAQRKSHVASAVAAWSRSYQRRCADPQRDDESAIHGSRGVTMQVFSMCIAESGGHITVGGQNRLGSLRNDMSSSSPPVLMWFAIPFGYSNSWGPTTQGRRASCTNILIHWFASAVNLNISEVSRSSTSRCDCLGVSLMSVAQMDVTLPHAALCNAELFAGPAYQDIDCRNCCWAPSALMKRHKVAWTKIIWIHKYIL